MTPSQLVPFVMANSSTMTGIIDRLERKGLVRRSRSSPDRRMVSISITGPGKALLQKIPLPVHPRVLKVLENLTAHERENIIEALKILTPRP
jgi:DNA-binding MarR family transcriptional regulator